MQNDFNSKVDKKNDDVSLTNLMMGLAAPCAEDDARARLLAIVAATKAKEIFKPLQNR